MYGFDFVGYLLVDEIEVETGIFVVGTQSQRTFVVEHSQSDFVRFVASIGIIVVQLGCDSAFVDYLRIYLCSLVVRLCGVKFGCPFQVGIVGRHRSEAAHSHQH